MRLIDADALKGVMIETLEKIEANPKMDNQEAHVIAAFHTVGLMIDDAPTVDAVPVVRCKDCKFYPDGDGTTKWVPCREIIIQHKWYCADGERKDDGDD